MKVFLAVTWIHTLGMKEGVSCIIVVFVSACQRETLERVRMVLGWVWLIVGVVALLVYLCCLGRMGVLS